MTDIMLPDNQPQVQTKQPVKEKKSFTKLQSFLLIFLTLMISVSGWYFAGKYFTSNLDMNRIHAQLEFYQQKVEVEPNNPKNLVNLGYTYFLLGKNERAIVELKRAIQLDKNYFDTYYNLGLVYHDESRLDDALEMFQKTVELSPKDYKGHMKKGMVYRELNMFDSALESLNKANQLNPSRADIIYEIGLVAEDQGDTTAAVEIFKDALTYDPLFKDAVEALERVQTIK